MSSQYDDELSREDLILMLDEKYDDINTLVSAIREIYAIGGEDKVIAKICNSVLENPFLAGMG